MKTSPKKRISRSDQFLDLIRTAESNLSFNTSSSNEPFTSIPHKIVTLKDRLRTLNLTGGYCPIIPPEIGELVLLRTLNLVNNKIENLPLEIGNLELLTELNIKQNLIKKLPNEIGKLTELNSLIANQNIVPPFTQFKKDGA